MTVVLNNRAAEYLRITSLAIAVYDYLKTLPAEWRFYIRWRQTGFSVSCGLFIAIRYTSILIISLSSYAYFYDDFTSALCNDWYLVPAALKVVQLMVCQAIMVWRLYVVFQRRPIVLWFLRIFYVICCIGEWVTSLLHRVFNVAGKSYNPSSTPVAWVYYLIAVIYDVVTTSMVIVCLVRLDARSHLMARLKKLLIYHGLMYFFALTVVNIMNLCMFRIESNDLQSAGTPISYTFIWIFSQQLLIHLNDISLKEKAKEKAKEDATVETIVISVTHTVDSVSDQAGSHGTQQLHEGDKESFEVDVNVRIRARRRSNCASSAGRELPV